MGMRLFKDQNMNKAIVFSILLSFAAKLFNFAQSVVISRAFGTQQSTDILFYMLSLVILVTTFQGSINEQVIIPTAISLRAAESEDASRRFLAFVYCVYTVVAVVLTSVLLMFPSDLLALLSRFSPDAIHANVLVVKLITASMVFIILNTYLLDIMVSYRYFTFPMLLDMLKNILIIGFVLILRGRFDVTSLAIGVFAGNIAQFIVLNVILHTVIRLKPSFKCPAISPEVKKNIFYVVAGRISTFANDFIIMYLLSGFAAGVYSAMDYASKIDTMVNMIIIGQISRVVGLKIIELHAKGSFEDLSTVFLRYLKAGLFFIFPVCFMISINAEGIVSILFERGSFTGESATLTAGFVRYFILLTPLEMVNSFVVMLIIAKQIQKIAFRWQILQNVMNIAVIAWMVGKWGYRGYPVGIIASTGLYILLLSYFLIKSQFAYIRPASILKPLAVNAGVNMAVALVFTGLVPRIPSGSGIILKMGWVAAVSAAYVGVVITVSFFTRINRDVMMDLLGYIRGFRASGRPSKLEGMREYE